STPSWRTSAGACCASRSSRALRTHVGSGELFECRGAFIMTFMTSGAREAPLTSMSALWSTHGLRREARPRGSGAGKPTSMWEPCTATVRRSASSPAARTILIAAHPDDEILGLGGQLADIPDLTLVQVTDGAPRDLSDARRAGFFSRSAYAAARALELDRALRAAQVIPAHRRALGMTDQEAVEHLAELLALVEEEIRGAAAVITHPYEGGHPGHDACALVVQCACERLRRSAGTAPV